MAEVYHSKKGGVELVLDLFSDKQEKKVEDLDKRTKVQEFWDEYECVGEENRDGENGGWLHEFGV